MGSVQAAASLTARNGRNGFRGSKSFVSDPGSYNSAAHPRQARPAGQRQCPSLDCARSGAEAGAGQRDTEHGASGRPSHHGRTTRAWRGAWRGPHEWDERLQVDESFLSALHHDACRVLLPATAPFLPTSHSQPAPRAEARAWVDPCRGRRGEACVTPVRSTEQTAAMRTDDDCHQSAIQPNSGTCPVSLRRPVSFLIR